LYPTGYPSSSRSFSGLLPWSGSVCWPLIRPTCEIFAGPPQAPEVAAPSAQWNGGVHFIPFARTFTRQTRAFPVVGHSVWNGLPLAQQLLPRVHSEFCKETLKLFFLDAQGSGEVLRSNLEEALCKCIVNE